MGRFATGVTVISAFDQDRVHGMTANGFMSVSLDPQLVLISVGQKARMKEIIDTAGHFGVSILGASQRRLSDHFAGKPSEGLDIPFAEAEGTPVIGGALLQITTRVAGRHPAGDHVLFVGEVTSFELGEGAPLIFHGGTYRALTQEYEWTSTLKNPDVQWY